MGLCRSFVGRYLWEMLWDMFEIVEGMEGPLTNNTEIHVPREGYQRALKKTVNGQNYGLDLEYPSRSRYEGYTCGEREVI